MANPGWDNGAYSWTEEKKAHFARVLAEVFGWPSAATVATMVQAGHISPAPFLSARLAAVDGNGPEFDPWFAVEKASGRPDSEWSNWEERIVTSGVRPNAASKPSADANALLDAANVLADRLLDQIAVLRENSNALRRLAKAMRKAAP